MRPTLITLMMLVACSGDEEPTPTTAPTEQAAAADAAPKLSPLEQAKAHVAARQHAEAIAALEALLAASEGDALFTLLALEAAAAGQAGAVLDRLDAATPIAGHEREHHRLRAELALHAGRPADASTAAGALRALDAEEGAVWQARAVQAGAPLPAALNPADPADALLLASSKPPAERGRALAALALSGWRARVWRAEQLAATDPAAARADLEAALASGEAAAVLAAGPLLAGLEDDPGNAAEHLSGASRAALELGFTPSAARAGAQAAALRLLAGQADAALTAAAELAEALKTAGDPLGAAELDLARALVALESGDASTTRTLSQSAGATATEQQDSALAARAAWLTVRAAYTLGLDAALEEATPALAEEHKATARALRLILVGRPAEALATEGLMRQLPDPAAPATTRAEQLALVQLHLAWARAADAAGQSPAAHTQAAVKAADLLGFLPSRVETRLEQDRYDRLHGLQSAALAELDALALTLPAAAPLQAEVAVRRLLAGQAATLPAEGLPAAAAPWAMLLGTAELPAASEGEAPLVTYARARKALADGELDAAITGLHSALSRLPTHHRGPWAPLSALGGAQGVGEAAALATLHGQASAAAAQAGLLLHDRWHGVQAMDRAFALGDDPSLGLSPEERAAYTQAHQALRAATLRWLVSGGEEPSAQLTTLQELDQKALATPSFARALPAPLADPRAFGDRLKGTAVLSYRLGPGRGEAILLSATGGRVHPLSDPAAIRGQAEALNRALRSGAAQGGTAVAPRLGDALRKALLDVFQAELPGLGRYLVLPDGPLHDLPPGAFPEQQAGLRFLADTRSIAVLSTASELLRAPAAAPERFTPDYLGLDIPEAPAANGADAHKATEVEYTARQFSPENIVRERGARASAAVFKEKAPTARFLHLAGLGVGDRAALAFGEGTLGLAELRALNLSGTIAILSAELPAAVRDRWVHALRAAGVATVISTAWAPPGEIGGRITHRFFEAAAQDRSPAMALADSQGTLRAEPNNVYFDPSWWALYFLHGQP